MRIIRVALAFCCLAMSAQTPEGNPIERAHAAGNAFAEAWNSWASQHNPYTISREDKERFKRVRKTWKEFDRLCREIEY